MPKGDEEKESKAEQRENAAAQYGWSLAMLESDPDLKKKFRTAIKEGWPAARFVAEVRETDWFKKNAESWRNNDILRTVDPGEWKNRRAKTRAGLADAAAGMGSILGKKQLERMADNVMMFGWDEAQQRNAMASYLKTVDSGPLKGQYIGDAGRAAAELRDTALNNGYKVEKKALAKWNRAIARGDSTVEDYQGFMRRQAALSFPSFATELEAGQDMRDIANPYINSMANILELNEAEIDLFDPTIRRALASKSEKTGKPEAMAIFDFESKLRSDTRWQWTDNAREQASNMALEMGRLMGVSG